MRDARGLIAEEERPELEFNAALLKKLQKSFVAGCLREEDDRRGARRARRSRSSDRFARPRTAMFPQRTDLRKLVSQGSFRTARVRAGASRGLAPDSSGKGATKRARPHGCRRGTCRRPIASQLCPPNDGSEIFRVARRQAGADQAVIKGRHCPVTRVERLRMGQLHRPATRLIVASTCDAESVLAPAVLWAVPPSVSNPNRIVSAIPIRSHPVISSPFRTTALNHAPKPAIPRHFVPFLT
jgi:hypothetical protein